MRRICLMSLHQTGVIVPEKTGVHFCNLIGPGGEREAQLEGLLIPVTNDPPADAPELALHARLNGLLHSAAALSPAQVSAVDSLLLEMSSTDHFQLHRKRLADSCAGWLWIAVTPAGEFSNFAGFDAFVGVLTWPQPGDL